jgi:hypothetical protein
MYSQVGVCAKVQVLIYNNQLNIKHIQNFPIKESNNLSALLHAEIKWKREGGKN